MAPANASVYFTALEQKRLTLTPPTFLPEIQKTGILNYCTVGQRYSIIMNTIPPLAGQQVARSRFNNSNHRPHGSNSGPQLSCPSGNFNTSAKRVESLATTGRVRNPLPSCTWRRSFGRNQTKHLQGRFASPSLPAVSGPCNTLYSPVSHTEPRDSPPAIVVSALTCSSSLALQSVTDRALQVTAFASSAWRLRMPPACCGSLMT